MTYKELGQTNGGWLYEMWPGEYVVTFADRRAERLPEYAPTKREAREAEVVLAIGVFCCLAVGFALGQWL